MSVRRLLHPLCGPAAARGFSLIEVLVAMAILAFGLLGLSALQMRGLADNKNALVRSQAQLFAQDIVERMRANRDLAQDGRYGLALANGTGDVAAAGLPQVVEDDLIDWLNQLSILPSGDGAIATTNLGGDRTRVVVTIQWGNRGSAARMASEGNTNSYVMESLL